MIHVPKMHVNSLIQPLSADQLPLTTEKLPLNIITHREEKTVPDDGEDTSPEAKIFKSSFPNSPLQTI